MYFKDLYQSKNYAKCIEECDDFLKDKQTSAAFNYKAMSYFKLNDFENAFKTIDHSIELFPELCNVKFKMLMDLEKYGEAYEFLMENDSDLSDYEMIFELFKNLSVDEILDFFNKSQQRDTDFIDSLKYALIEDGADEAKKVENTLYISWIYEAVSIQKEYFNEKIKLLTDCLLDWNNQDYPLHYLRDKFYFFDEREFGEFINHLISTEYLVMPKKGYVKLKNHDSGLDYKELHDEKRNLIYKGFVKENAVFGEGTTFFENGCKYQEGIFDVKGLVKGREYYPNGNLRFSGKFIINMGYGPNYPIEGEYYSHEGDLIFKGRFDVKRGGVGFPMIKNPNYGTIVQKHSEIPYYKIMWW